MSTGLTALERTDSLAERAYQALREQIAAGGLAPGERVTERGLALRLGVSATPVREALLRLEAERLVERISPRDLRIAAHSAQTVRELIQAQITLRALAARFATRKISEPTLARMESLLDELERHPAEGDPEHQLALAREFDDLLLAAAGNDVLGAMIDSLSVFGWAVRLRAVHAMHAEPEVGLSRLQAHRDVLTALRDRDADRVESLTRTYLTAGAEYFLAHSGGPVDE
jgi:DNA-binding GntR family transcriptional regulator